jgi:hypothetical protein
LAVADADLCLSVPFERAFDGFDATMPTATDRASLGSSRTDHGCLCSSRDRCPFGSQFAKFCAEELDITLVENAAIATIMPRLMVEHRSEMTGIEPDSPRRRLSRLSASHLIWSGRCSLFVFCCRRRGFVLQRLGR